MKVEMNMPEPPDGYEWTGATEEWDKGTTTGVTGDCNRVLCHYRKVHKEPELLRIIHTDGEKIVDATYPVGYWDSCTLAAAAVDPGDLDLIVCRGLGKDSSVGYYMGHWNDGPKERSNG